MDESSLSHAFSLCQAGLEGPQTPISANKALTPPSPVVGSLEPSQLLASHSPYDELATSSSHVRHVFHFSSSFLPTAASLVQV